MAAALTVEESPATILDAITELAARWHRHSSDEGTFMAGMRTGWAQGIALLLKRPVNEVEASLRTGAL